MRLVLMGVSGCGKSSVGAALGPRLGLDYVDGDDLHPAENIEKMRQGLPLTDADRAPWLDRLAERLVAGPEILGCSALRRSYRARLAVVPVRFIHLSAPKEVIAARLTARRGQSMPPARLDSQFATLEPPGPEEALQIDETRPLDLVVDDILAALRQ